MILSRGVAESGTGASGSTAGAAGSGEEKMVLDHSARSLLAQAQPSAPTAGRGYTLQWVHSILFVCAALLPNII